MTLTYDWVFETSTQQTVLIGNLSGVITDVRVGVYCQDVAISQVTGYTYADVNLAPPNPATFVPDAKITRAMLVSWARDALGSYGTQVCENQALANFTKQTTSPPVPFIPKD